MLLQSILPEDVERADGPQTYELSLSNGEQHALIYHAGTLNVDGENVRTISIEGSSVTFTLKNASPVTCSLTDLWRCMAGDREPEAEEAGDLLAHLLLARLKLSSNARLLTRFARQFMADAQEIGCGDGLPLYREPLDAFTLGCLDRCTGTARSLQSCADVLGVSVAQILAWGAQRRKPWVPQAEQTQEERVPSPILLRKTGDQDDAGGEGENSASCFPLAGDAVQWPEAEELLHNAAVGEEEDSTEAALDAQHDTEALVSVPLSGAEPLEIGEGEQARKKFWTQDRLEEMTHIYFQASGTAAERIVSVAQRYGKSEGAIKAQINMLKQANQWPSQDEEPVYPLDRGNIVWGITIITKDDKKGENVTWVLHYYWGEFPHRPGQLVCYGDEVYRLKKVDDEKIQVEYRDRPAATEPVIEANGVAAQAGQEGDV